MSGANEAGSVRFQPLCATLDNRNACRGPGCIEAAIANPAPRNIFSINLVMPYPLPLGGSQTALSCEVPRSALRPRSEAEWGLWRATGVCPTAMFSPHPYHTTLPLKHAPSPVRSSDWLARCMILLAFPKEMLDFAEFMKSYPLVDTET